MKPGLLTFVALAVAALVAGCGTLSQLNGGKPAGTDSANSASAERTGNQMATPYNQPLMATGGDLAMVQRPARGVAGQSSGC